MQCRADDASRSLYNSTEGQCRTYALLAVESIRQDFIGTTGCVLSGNKSLGVVGAELTKVPELPR